VSDGRELESRIERLETALQAIDARLAKLEHRPSRGGQPPPAVLPVASTDTETSALGLFGISILILGGAFVMRALTESAVLPRLGGAILGLAYAGVWTWNADRLARAHRVRAALFHAVTAAVIAFPLVWETTIRFHIIPAIVASVAVGALGLLFLWVAVRNQQQALAWTGSAAAIIAAFAIGPSAAMLVALAAIGAATTLFAKDWEFAAWPAALASNIIALILIVTRGPGTVAALVCFSALWVAPATIGRKRDIFVTVQSTVAILIGVGGATLLLMPSAAAASLIWSAAGLGTAALARRKAVRAMALQSVVWIVAAALAGGLLLSTIGAFAGERGSIELPPTALATGLVALVAFVLLEGRGERVVLLSAFLCMAFTGTVAVVLPAMANAALLRTAVLAIFASLLAVVGRLIGNCEASILARAVLVIGGMKLLGEDLRVGTAAILVISFASYGAALLVVSRSGWARAAAHQAQPDAPTPPA
jgi:hypothetical protein